MRAAVRVNRLDMSALSAQETHGKRGDRIGQARRVRDVPPLVHGGLNLRELYDQHVEGARQNRGFTKPVLHLLIQFPTDLPITEATEKAMLRHARQFVDGVYGGRAVFAARLDRDEKARHTVDVFASPRYEKETRSGMRRDWISTTRHAKLLCQKHRDEIERRMGAMSTSLRAIGMALQSEWAHYLRSYDLAIEPKREKQRLIPDRVEPEVYAAERIAAAKAAEAAAAKAAEAVRSEREAMRGDAERLWTWAAEVGRHLGKRRPPCPPPP